MQRGTGIYIPSGSSNGYLLSDTSAIDSSSGVATILMWIQCVGHTANMRYLYKGTNFQLTEAGTGEDDFSIVVGRATVNAQSDSSGDIMAAGVWKYLACVYDESDTTVGPKIYHGSETAIVAEASYATQTAGSGATTSTSATDAQVFYRAGGSNRTINAEVAYFHWINAALTFEEIRRDQFNYGIAHASSAVLWHPGADGSLTTIQDYSGNGNTGAQQGSGNTLVRGPSVGRLGSSRRFTWSAGGGGAFSQSVAGTITPTGTVGVEVGVDLAGVVTPAGAVDVGPGISPAGTITPTGTLSAKAAFFQSVAGTVTPAGVVAVDPGISGAGTVAPTGSLNTNVGSVQVSGAVTPTGALDVGPGIAPAGTVTPTGTVSTRAGYAQSVAGSVTPAGVVGVEVGVSVVGTVTPSGTVGLAVEFDNLRSTTIPTGTLSAKIGGYLQSVAGTVTPAGTVGMAVAVTLVSTTTPTGTLATQTAGQQAVAGTVTPAGALVVGVGVDVAGTVTPVGTVSPVAGAGAKFQSVAGTVTPAGTVGLGVGVQIVGTVTPVGVLSSPAFATKALVSAITWTGPTISGTGTFTGPGIGTTPTFT